MTIFHIGKRNKDSGLSIAERAVADKVISTLDVSSKDSVLEISNGQCLTDCGVFSKYGCYCKTTKTLSLLDGGEYDYIVFFNLANDVTAYELRFVDGHLSPCGKVVVLNTKNPLSPNDMIKLAALLGKSCTNPVANADFSLLIID